MSESINQSLIHSSIKSFLLIFIAPNKHTKHTNQTNATHPLFPHYIVKYDVSSSPEIDSSCTRRSCATFSTSASRSSSNVTV